MGCNGVSCCCKEKLILNEKLETCDKGGGRSLDELEFYLRFRLIFFYDYFILSAVAASRIFFKRVNKELKLKK